MVVVVQMYTSSQKFGHTYPFFSINFFFVFLNMLYVLQMFNKAKRTYAEKIVILIFVFMNTIFYKIQCVQNFDLFVVDVGMISFFFVPFKLNIFLILIPKCSVIYFPTYLCSQTGRMISQITNQIILWLQRRVMRTLTSGLKVKNEVKSSISE